VILITLATGFLLRLLAIRFGLGLPVFDYQEDKNWSWVEKLPKRKK
jgi:uncharacterized membrane protein YeiH